MAIKVGPPHLPSFLAAPQVKPATVPEIIEPEIPEESPSLATPPASPEGPDASHLFAAGLRPLAVHADPQLQHDLLVAHGTAFDLAIEKTWREGAPEAEAILRATVKRCTHQLRPEGTELPVADQLQNYLWRLRGVRLLMALEDLGARGGPRSIEVPYPLSGYDVLPSLFFPAVLAIDWRVPGGSAPVQPLHYRQRLIRQQLVRTNDRGERHDETVSVDGALRALFDAVAAEPHRHRAIEEDAFGPRLPERLNLTEAAARLLFFKGLDWMVPPLDFSGGGIVRERAAAAVWLADALTRKGDAIALWEASPEVEAALLAGGRYAPWRPAFLGKDELARLEGTALPETKFLIEPVARLDPRYTTLNFVVPRFLRLFRRVT